MKTGQSLNVVASGTGKSIFWNKNMNERIRELAEQAKFTWVENDKDITGGVDLEKFAELIVQECVGIVAKRKDQAIDDGWNVDEAMSMAEMDLEEHFGVEE
jgi:hypothetical protein